MRIKFTTEYFLHFGHSTNFTCIFSFAVMYSLPKLRNIRLIPLECMGHSEKIRHLKCIYFIGTGDINLLFLKSVQFWGNVSEGVEHKSQTTRNWRFQYNQHNYSAK